MEQVYKKAILINAKPLEGFSSWHEWALVNFCGYQIGRITAICSFNNTMPISYEQVPTLTIHSHPLDKPKSQSKADLYIKDLNQWELDLKPFKSFDDYLHHLNSNQRRYYFKSQKSFVHHGCRLKVIEGDWSEYAEHAYELYQKMAAKYFQIYDLNYFQEIAKRHEGKFISAWYKEQLIGILGTIEEGKTLHSTVAGLDYLHSKPSFTYSVLHYEFIRIAIEANRFAVADAGVSADNSKHAVGFNASPAVVEIFGHGKIARAMLFLINRFLKLTLDSDDNVKMRIRWPFS